MKTFVLSYEDHKNDYAKIPIVVNSTEEYMTAGWLMNYEITFWNFILSGLLFKVVNDKKSLAFNVMSDYYIYTTFMLS